jgi:recombination protein RecA
MFGNPETTSGGNALKFYASLRIDIRRIGAIKAGDAVIGNKTKVKIIKNKLSPPFREAEVQIMYGMGISKVHDMLDWGESLGVVKKSGAWYTYGEDRFQGRENFAQILTSDPIFFEKLKDEVRSKMDPNIMKVATVEDTN